MNVEKIKEKANQYISNGQPDKALCLLQDNLMKRSALYSEMSAIGNRLSDVAEKFNGDRISYEEYKISSAKVVDQILYLIKKVSEEDLKKRLKGTKPVDIKVSYINIVLKMSYTGHEMILEVPENMMVLKFKEELIEDLESEHGMCFTLENGKRLSTCLHRSNGVKLNDIRSFCQNKIYDGDELRLIAYLWC